MSSLEDNPNSSSASNVPITNVSPDTNEVSPDTNDKPQVNLLDVPINGEVDALNVIVGFLGIAQRRGCFAINESAKIYECVQMFNQKQKS
jgi:hypothetical protein